MEILPFVLVIVSSFSHAVWNFLAKGAIEKDVFIGLSKVVEAALFAVPFLLVVRLEGFELAYGYFVLVAAFFVFLNYFFLSRAYHWIDLSVAYPVSRSSTLFLPAVAFIFLEERIDGIGWFSVLLILVGVFFIYADSLLEQRKALTKNAGIRYALLAAFTVACYTVWDKMAIEHFHPFVYFYSYTFLTSAFYGGVLVMRFKREQIRHEWGEKKRAIVSVAFLNTFTYLLVLVALGLSKATYVGALRQLSLVVGVFLGWKMLGERVSKMRVFGVLGLIIGSLLTLFAK